MCVCVQLVKYSLETARFFFTCALVSEEYAAMLTAQYAALGSRAYDKTYHDASSPHKQHLLTLFPAYLPSEALTHDLLHLLPIPYKLLKISTNFYRTCVFRYIDTYKNYRLCSDAEYLKKHAPSLQKLKARVEVTT